MAAYIPTTPEWSWPFDPRTIGECKLWLDATDSNRVDTTPGYVSTWSDKSGYGYTASNFRANDKVSYTTAAAGINGNAAINYTFDSAIPNYCRGSLRSAIPAGTFPNGVTGFVVFMSMNSLNLLQACSVVGRVVETTGSNQPNPGPFVMSNNVGVLPGVSLRRFGDGTTAWKEYSNCSFNFRSQATPLIYTFTIGSDLDFNEYSNSISQTLPAATLSGTPVYGDVANFLYVGALSNYTRGGFEGKIGEVIMYNGVLPDDDRQFVENYLSQKWGIALDSTIARFFSNRPYTRYFLPYDFSNCRAWYTAEHPSNMTRSGSNVLTWVDKTASNFDLSAIANPLYDDTNKYVIFNGTTNALTISGGSSLCVNVSFTIMCVEERTSNKASNYFIGGTAGATNSNLSIGYLTDTSAIMSFSGNDITGAVPAYSIGDLPRVWTFAYGNGTRDIFLNGSNVATQNTSQNLLAWTTPTIGRSGANYYAGNLRDIIFFNTRLPQNRQRQVEGYLARKYGLSSNLSSNNSFKLYLTPASPVFDPRSISNLNHWYDGADICGNGTRFADGATLSGIWRNKLANTLLCNATSTTAATFSTTFNSPTFTTTTRYNLSGMGSAAQGLTTSFMVIRPSSIGLNQGILGGSGVLSKTIGLSSSGNSIFLRYSDTDNPPNAKWVWVSNAAPAVNTPAIITCFNNTTTGKIQFYSNAFKYPQSAVTIVGLGSTLTTLGAGYQDLSGLPGQYYEILLYRRELSQIELDRIHSYLGAKWNIPLSGNTSYTNVKPV